MESIDPNIQRRVWQRVYRPQEQNPRLSPQQRRSLLQCLHRTNANLAAYESLRTHPVYGEAFARMAGETREHQKMLNQMLNRR